MPTYFINIFIIVKVSYNNNDGGGGYFISTRFIFFDLVMEIKLL